MRVARLFSDWSGVNDGEEETPSNNLLLEDGEDLLLEDGEQIILED